MRTLLALTMAAILAVPALAQRPPGGPGGFGGMMGRGGDVAMLQSPDVQKELKITDEQKKKITAFQQKMT